MQCSMSVCVSGCLHSSIVSTFFCLLSNCDVLFVTNFLVGLSFLCVFEEPWMPKDKQVLCGDVIFQISRVITHVLPKWYEIDSLALCKKRKVQHTGQHLAHTFKSRALDFQYIIHTVIPTIWTRGGMVLMFHVAEVFCSLFKYSKTALHLIWPSKTGTKKRFSDRWSLKAGQNNTKISSSPAGDFASFSTCFQWSSILTMNTWPF